MKLQEFNATKQVARNDNSVNYSIEVIDDAELQLNAIAGEGDIIPAGELSLVMAVVMQDDHIIKQNSGADSRPRAYIQTKQKMLLSYSSFRHYAGIASVKFEIAGTGNNRKIKLSKSFQIKRKPELVNNRYDWTTAEAVTVE